MNIFSPKEENKSQFDNFVQDFWSMMISFIIFNYILFLIIYKIFIYF
jgi:hypothetical protein